MHLTEYDIKRRVINLGPRITCQSVISPCPSILWCWRILVGNLPRSATRESLAAISCKDRTTSCTGLQRPIYSPVLLSVETSFQLPVSNWILWKHVPREEKQNGHCSDSSWPTNRYSPNCSQLSSIVTRTQFVATIFLLVNQTTNMVGTRSLYNLPLITQLSFKEETWP